MRKSKVVFTCEEGDFVMHNGKKMCVAEIITPGRESFMVKVKGSTKKREQVGRRSDISACPIAQDNGQIMTRSPRCIGQEWEHV